MERSTAEDPDDPVALQQESEFDDADTTVWHEPSDELDNDAIGPNPHDFNVEA